MIRSLVNAIVSALAEWRIVKIPGNPNGEIYLIDRKPA